MAKSFRSLEPVECTDRGKSGQRAIIERPVGPQRASSFLRDGEVRGHTAVVTSLTFPGGLEVKTVHVPEAVSAGGYDTIRVTRIASADLVAALGYIRFGRP